MKTIQVIIVVGAIIGLSGCNTARGLGADLELLGKRMKTMGNGDDTVVVEGTSPVAGQVTDVYQEGSVQVETYPVNSQPVYQETYTDVPSAATGTTYPTEIIIDNGQALPQ